MGSILCVMFLTFSVVILSNTEVRVLQAQNEASSALLEWKASLDLESQLTLVSWDRNNPCQSWLGIKCSHTPQSEWVVTDISLSILSLKGRLDSLNFSSFRHLEVLDLYANSLYGSIPSNLVNASQLQILELSHNDFSGVIPSEIGMLPFLEKLSLGGNKLTGHIPNTIANLTSLTQFELYNNEITGPIPQEIGMLSATLEWLHFGSNNLTGEIPSSLGNLTHLNCLFLNNNQLSGTIPPELVGAKDLIHLSISNNQLSGTIPPELGGAKDLIFLDISDNHLSGTIPPELGELGGAKDLIFLDISYNHLSGPIPNFTMLGSLYLSFNNLSGSFPKDINLSKITWLFVDNNRLSGPLPRVGKLVKKFVASNNLFSGGIPFEIGHSSSLNTLDLSKNQLSGPIPDTFFLSKSFQFLKLDDNMFHGTLPKLPINIIAYSVKNNRMAGELPSGICSSWFLEVLHLSNNNFIGELPDCFGNHSLTSLNLNGNRLQGPVPRSLINCELLQVLDLGNNIITDTFPHWLDSLPQLQVLVLKSNNLHGTIKSSSSNLPFPKLRILDVSRNLFTGHLPLKYFENFKAMMDIGEGGGGPIYIGTDRDSYKDIVVLVVKGLELKFERILTILTTVDLSDNKFEGEIPSNIKILNSLRYLNLSHNHLSGRLPAMLDNLTKLESLDLSANQLKGKIPAELSKLTFLVVFNVSSNQLSGTIPQGQQFNTFGNDSYQGNPGLCGFPLHNKCGDNDVPSQLQEEEEDDISGFFAGFTWESVVLGYGCGIVLGVGLGCLMFSTGKPVWVMKIVTSQKRRKRPEIFQFATRRN